MIAYGHNTNADHGFGVVGELRPDHGQGDAADGPQRGGAAVLGGPAPQEDTEVRIQGSRPREYLSHPKEGLHFVKD